MSLVSELWVSGTGQHVEVHERTQACLDHGCVIHNQSDHHMADWPTHWRGDRGIMERICPHGVGHPDPDDMAFRVRSGNDADGIHGCDGCCHPATLARPVRTPPVPGL